MLKLLINSNITLTSNMLILCLSLKLRWIICYLFLTSNLLVKTINSLLQFIASSLFHEMHAIACAHTGMHASLRVQFIKCAKSYFHFLLYYNIFPIRRMFPNVVYTAGKEILFELLGWMFKTPSKLELCLESKYFVISVADQISFMNWLLTESSNCLYIHI